MVQPRALKRLEELAAPKDENVIEVSNVEVPRSRNPIEIHFSGEIHFFGEIHFSGFHKLISRNIVRKFIRFTL